MNGYIIREVFGPTFGLQMEGWLYTLPVRYYGLLTHPAGVYGTVLDE